MMSGPGGGMGAGWRPPFLPSFPGHLFQARQGWSPESTDLFHSGRFSPQTLAGHGAGASTVSSITVRPSSALGSCYLPPSDLTSEHLASSTPKWVLSCDLGFE